MDSRRSLAGPPGPGTAARRAVHRVGAHRGPLEDRCAADRAPHPPPRVDVVRGPYRSHLVVGDVRLGGQRDDASDLAEALPASPLAVRGRHAPRRAVAPPRARGGRQRRAAAGAPPPPEGGHPRQLGSVAGRAATDTYPAHNICVRRIGALRGCGASVGRGVVAVSGTEISGAEPWPLHAVLDR